MEKESKTKSKNRIKKIIPLVEELMVLTENYIVERNSTAFFVKEPEVKRSFLQKRRIAKMQKKLASVSPENLVEAKYELESSKLLEKLKPELKEMIDLSPIITEEEEKAINLYTDNKDFDLLIELLKENLKD